MKKLISVLLVTVLLFTLIPFTASAQGDGKVYIKADSYTYQLSKGDTFDYIYYLCNGEKLCSLQGVLYYDSSDLEIVYGEDEELSDLFPQFVIQVVPNETTPGYITYNYGSIRGADFSFDDTELIHVTFRVIADEGFYLIRNKLDVVQGKDEHDYLDKGVVVDDLIRSEGMIDDMEPYTGAVPYQEPGDPFAEPVLPTDAPSDAPTVEPTVTPTGEPTAAPTDTPTVEPTAAPTDEPTAAPTDEPTAAPTDAPTAEPTEKPTDPDLDGLFVKVDGAYYQVNKGDVFDYVFYLNTGEKLCSLDADMYYDTAGLEMIYDDEEGIYSILPVIGDYSEVNQVAPGRITFNFSSPKGIKCNSDNWQLIHASFCATADSGIYEIDTFLKTVSGANETNYVFNYVTLIPLQRAQAVLPDQLPYDTGDPDATSAPTDKPTDVPTDDPTAEPSVTPTSEPTQQPTAEPTEEPTGDATTAPTSAPTDTPTGGADPDGLFIKADGVLYKVNKGDTFDYVFYLCTGERLCSLDATTTYNANGLEIVYEEDEEIESLFPNLSIAVTANEDEPGVILFNMSNSKGIKCSANDWEMIHVTFRVTADSGVLEINTVLKAVAGADEVKYIFNYVHLLPLQRAESSIPDLTVYDPDNPDPPTQEPTDPPTDPPTAEPTDDPTSSSTEEPTVAPTDTPTDEPAASEELFIKADGVLYKVNKGDVFEYVYYLNTGDKLSSLDANLYYDTEGLEVVYEDDDEIESLFPKIATAVIANEYVHGWIIFNFSNAKGIKCNSDSWQLIHARFAVTADSGTYEINTILKAVVGPDDHRFIFNYENIEPLPKAESTVPGLIPYDPDNPDPPTDPPTEAPTDPPTDPPTEAPTEPPYLIDAATGIKVMTDLDVQLRVNEIDPEDYRYYLYDSAKLRIYDISLIKNGAAVALGSPLEVRIPSNGKAAVYTISHTNSVNMTPVKIDTTAGEGYVAFDSTEFGTFIFSANGSDVRAALYGDAENNNELTIVDASFIQRHLAHIDTFSEQQLLIADADKNHEITILDATQIQRWLARLSSSIDALDYPH